MKFVHYIQLALGALVAAAPAVAASLPPSVSGVVAVVATMAATCLTVLGVVSPSAGAPKPPVQP